MFLLHLSVLRGHGNAVRARDVAPAALNDRTAGGPTSRPLTILCLLLLKRYPAAVTFVAAHAYSGEGYRGRVLGIRERPVREASRLLNEAAAPPHMEPIEETTTRHSRTEAGEGTPGDGTPSTTPVHPHMGGVRPGRLGYSLLCASVAVHLYAAAATFWLCGRVDATEVNFAEHARAVHCGCKYVALPEPVAGPQLNETSPEEGVLSDTPQLLTPAKTLTPKVAAAKRRATKRGRAARRRRARSAARGTAKRKRRSPRNDWRKHVQGSARRII